MVPAVLRRVPHRVVSDLAELVGLAAAAPAGLVLVIDADGCLVPQGVSAEEFRAATRAALDRLTGVPGIARAEIVTNGPARGADWVTERIDKPWTSRRRLGLRGVPRRSIWVVGDQVIADGLLARRLAGRFLQLVISVDFEPRAQARLRRLGRLVAPLMLRKEKSPQG